MKNILRLLAVLGLFGSAFSACADDQPGFFARAWNEVTHTWDVGTNEYYATFHTWHLPWAYSEEKNKEYQNSPPGFGFGRGYFDDKGNWHGVYALGFQDSHFKPEWNVGYGWKTYWNPVGDMKVGLGYTAGLTARTDFGHYAPVPMLLPIASIDYGKVSVEGAYVPGSKGFGNVILFWAKWHSDDRSIFGWKP